MSRLRYVAAAGVLALLAAACGPPPRPALPSGAGTPFSGFAAAYEQAIQDCNSVRTITAELALSGRAAGTKLRGRINAGFSAPDDIVLEGLAPFGKPVFVLFGRGGQATLWLPRDERVLTGVPPASIIEALAGVALTPSELRAAVAGCGLGTGTPANGRTFNADWAAVDSPAGTTYLRRVDGRWRVGAAVRNDLTVQYGDFAAGRAGTVYVRTPVADLALRLSQLETNTTIDPRAFEVEVPAGASPLTLEELRRAGPLGERR
jgi:hypothetical protein